MEPLDSDQTLERSFFKGISDLIHCLRRGISEIVGMIQYPLK